VARDDARFKVDDPVRISEASMWAQGATGRIALPPTSLLESIEAIHGIDPGWDGAMRTAVIDGVMTVGWYVAFDKPQFDEDGEGPMAGGEFAEALLLRF